MEGRLRKTSLIWDEIEKNVRLYAENKESITTTITRVRKTMK